MKQFKGVEKTVNGEIDVFEILPGGGTTQITDLDRLVVRVINFGVLRGMNHKDTKDTKEEKRKKNSPKLLTWTTRRGCCKSIPNC